MPTDDITNDAPIVTFEDGRSRTLMEFCKIEHMSLSSFYALKNRGHAPDLIHPPHSKLIRITAEAHAEWRKKMRELAKTEAAALEQERRHRQAVKAGKRAAEVRAAS